MSTYTYRYVEVLREQIDGYRWKYEKLPDPEQHVGEIYKINEYNLPDGVFRYYESVKDDYSTPAHWDGRETVTMKWVPVKWYFEKSRIDKGEPSPYDEKWDAAANRFETTDKFGKKHYLEEGFVWANNGGYIRDDYIGRSFGDKYFQERGLPKDVSPEIKKDIESDYHYGMTYVLLSEWETLFESEMEKFVKEVKKRFRDEKIEDILTKVTETLALNKKMAKILQNLQSHNENEIEIKDKKERKKKEDDEGYYYEDTIDYMFEEEIYRLFHIREEIDRCNFIIEELGDCFMGSDKVRIIYYLA